MKIVPKLLILAAALFALAVPSLSHAQTTYAIGSSLCGTGSTTWIDCYNMPITAKGQTTTAWIEMDYHANAEDFLTGPQTAIEFFRGLSIDVHRRPPCSSWRPSVATYFYKEQAIAQSDNLSISAEADFSRLAVCQRDDKRLASAHSDKS